ncbi:DUF2283 domain-containing protein [Thermococcus waiotapuensis]|uniref:DUF2283 domain-containing protein n=1 Tax=Thermococcus waiotapuensis TaxID=90909 RepID=A0AAE4NUQ2_9EURY|nr:DUF2283 domain-containing protein [Thermococcus waiotapuensis]MDV3102977.1 DUF2283 domain-containing protein [Thermococcus waiotapuensis]
MVEVEKRLRPIDYDLAVDSLFVSVPGREYKSIMVGDDLILDFGVLPGEDKLGVVGFELLGASKKFGVDRHVLRNIKGLHAEIIANEEWVKLKLSVVVLHRRKEQKGDKVLEVANSGIPKLTSSITV